jgi:hypothetical protein
MQHMRSYYAFNGTIRYYGYLPKELEVVPTGAQMGTPGDLKGTLSPERTDSSRWKEPPHIVLANLTNPNLGAIQMFIRKYGPLAGRSTTLRAVNGAPQFYENVAKFKSFQKLLQEAWTAKDDAIKEIGNRIEINQERYDEKSKQWVGGRSKIWLSASGQSIEAHLSELVPFICLLFLRDYAAGNTGVCANPDCLAPYFLRDRQGQQFCTHKCAVLINVRRFRAAQRNKAKKKKH